MARQLTLLVDRTGRVSPVVGDDFNRTLDRCVSELAMLEELVESWRLRLVMADRILTLGAETTDISPVDQLAYVLEGVAIIDA